MENGGLRDVTAWERGKRKMEGKKQGKTRRRKIEGKNGGGK